MVCRRDSVAALSAALLVTASALPISSRVQAQESTTLEEVVVEGEGQGGDAKGEFQGYTPSATVGATKSETPLAKTPQAVSVVGSEQIEDQAARTVVEATRYSPGIRSETFGNDVRNDWFLIRGFSSQISSYFLDGLQLQSSDSFATWKVNPYLLERIDILRGPSSALYGSSNPGGLINLVSKHAEFRNGGEAGVGVNEYGNVWSGVDVQGVNASNTLAARIVATGNIGETEVDFIDNDTYAILPTVTWAPTDSTSFTAYANISRLETRSQNFLPYVGTVEKAPFGYIRRDLFTSDPAADSFTRKQALVGYEFEHRFNDAVTVRQNLRYGKLEVDYTGFYGLGWAAGSPTETVAETARGALDTHPELDLFNLDNQLELKGDTGPLAHTLLLGIDYKNFDLDDDQAYGGADNFDILNPDYDGGFTTVPDIRDVPGSLTRTKQEQTGFYAHDRIEIDRLNVVLSGRYDSVSTDIEDRVLDTDTDFSDHALSGRAGVIYNFENGISPYASVSRSFLPVVGTDGGTGEPFDAETARQYEVGLRYQPEAWGDSLIGVSLFDLTRQNVVTSDGAIFNRQIGEVSSQGVEFEAVGEITDSLKFVGAYTIYDLEIEEGNPAEIGKVPTGTPEQFGSLWLDYSFHTDMLEGLSLGAGARYVGRSFADAANDLDVPDVWLADAGVRYERDQFSAALNVSNLFDKRYVASCNGTCYYGESREVNLTLSYKW